VHITTLKRVLPWALVTSSVVCHSSARRVRNFAVAQNLAGQDRSSLRGCSRFWVLQGPVERNVEAYHLQYAGWPQIAVMTTLRPQPNDQ
jgi:hypothetical protein